jgi:hypothetical protein
VVMNNFSIFRYSGYFEEYNVQKELRSGFFSPQDNANK